MKISGPMRPGNPIVDIATGLFSTIARGDISASGNISGEAMRLPIQPRYTNWPCTIFLIPTNRRLMNTPPGAATGETRRTIGR